MSSTQEVLTRHLDSFGSCNLDGVMADYASSAILFTPVGALKGLDQIRTQFVTMFEEFSKPGVSFSMQTMVVDGDFAYIVWNAETADNVYELGTDTFVVRNGKIVAQSYAGKVTAKVAPAL